MLFPVLFFMDAGYVVGFVDGGRPNLARSSHGGDARRRRVQIRELEVLGRSPGRRAINDGFIPSSKAGVYFDSTQSKLAKGPLQLMVVLVFFFGGVDRR
jgi:hypothetical protein